MVALLTNFFSGIQYSAATEMLSAIRQLNHTLFETVAVLDHLKNTFEHKYVSINSLQALNTENRNIENKKAFRRTQRAAGKTDATVPYDYILRGIYKQNNSRQEETILASKSLMKKVREIAEFTGNLIGAIEAMDVLPPVPKNVEKPIAKTATVSKTISGTSKVINARHSGVGVSESVLAIGELAAVAAEQRMSPMGGKIFAASLAAGGSTEHLENDEREQKNTNRHIQHSKREQIFAGLEFGMTAASADHYVRNGIQHLSDQVKVLEIKSLAAWKKPFNPADSIDAKFGTNAYDPVGRNVMGRDNTLYKPNLTPDEMKASYDRTPIAQHYVQFARPIIADLVDTGKAAFEQLTARQIAVAKVNDLQRYTNTAEMANTAVMEGAVKLLQTAIEGSSSGSFVTIPRTSKPGTDNQRGQNKTVTVNINRPLIEHFSIHTNSMSETTSTIRHKVEEVLLEILESANSIN